MKAPQNHIFITVESEFNDRIQTKSGQTLYLSSTLFHSEEGEKVAPYAIKRHYGTVYGNPGGLTDDVKVIPEKPGNPSPGRYIPNDDIIKMIQSNVPVDSWSSLNLFVHKWKTCADFEREVMAGDKIYFHFNTISDNNLVQYLGEKIYKLRYPDAICVVREPEIIPVAGHVLIDPLWEDGVEDLGDGKRGKLSSSGLVTELHDKPKYLEGIVRYVCQPMKGEDIPVVPGDKILYPQHADWEVEIEGKKFYVMKYWEIEAKFEE